jgi:hypothetical protein
LRAETKLIVQIGLKAEIGLRAKMRGREGMNIRVATMSQFKLEMPKS